MNKIKTINNIRTSKRERERERKEIRGCKAHMQREK